LSAFNAYSPVESSASSVFVIHRHSSTLPERVLSADKYKTKRQRVKK